MLTSMRLFGDGKHGRTEPIQTFRGPACRPTFTCRRNTPLSRLKTPSQQVAVVLSALAEGLDPSAAERVFGFRQATITSLSNSRWETGNLTLWLKSCGPYDRKSTESSNLPFSPPSPSALDADECAPFLSIRGVLLVLHLVPNARMN